MDNALRKKLDRCNRKRQPQSIIDTLEALPADQRDYDAIMHLARAYNNRRRDGDYDHAIALLQSVADRGQNDPPLAIPPRLRLLLQQPLRPSPARL